MTVAVVTGGRDRTPSMAELERMVEVMREYETTIVRHGACPPRTNDRGQMVGSTDTLVGAWVKARGLAEVEAWPADWERHGRAAGPRRNRGMLAGALDGKSGQPASVLIRFNGGVGTRDCVTAAFERGLVSMAIYPVDEPRPWNRHHGEPPGPSVYVGRGSPLGNPFKVEVKNGQTRAEAAGSAMAQYKRWLWSRVNPKSEHRAPTVVGALAALTPEHYLICSCWPAHCHAEVIVQAWRHQRAAP